jgi:predicted kinase
VRGKPGSGKSTLMKEGLKRAETAGFSHSFSITGFSFTHRTNIHLQRSPLGLFMTLLYKLIQQDKALL